jgi:hypothetical protein
MLTIMIGGGVVWLSISRKAHPPDLSIGQSLEIESADRVVLDQTIPYRVVAVEPNGGLGNALPQDTANDLRTGHQRDDNVEPWKGIDSNGQLRRIGERGGCIGVVMVFLNTDCPIANASIPLLNRLEKQFGEKIEIYGVVVSDDSRPTVRAYIEEYSIEFTVLVDSSHELKKRLGASHSPHAFLLNHFRQTVYDGAIDNSFPSLGKHRVAPSKHFLRDAIESLISNQSITTRQTTPVGCRIPLRQSATADLRSDNSSRFSFARHIAPLIYGNCSKCHQPQAVAPFSLLSYEDVVKHAAQIRVVVEHRLMPPWKPTHGYADFRDEQRLTIHEINMLREWIDTGMQLGPVSELPDPPINQEGWQLGRPDLVLEVAEPFDVSADGPDIYQYFVLPTNLLEDRLVEAIEYQPGNARVVHHASFRYDDAGNARELDRQFAGPGYQRFGGWGFRTGGTLGGWAMGVVPQRMPIGFGRPIKSGSDLVIQTHYHPSGKPETDQARVGIHFAPRSTKRRVAELFVANMNLHIPPNKRHHVHHASYVVPCNTTLYSVLPHAHLLARQVRAWAVEPANLSPTGKPREIPLIEIEDWDFNWQGDYTYREPIRLRQGTVIHLEFTFDNSGFNPLNPHQIPRWIHWGEDSAQEMAVCFFDVTADTESELDAMIEHNQSYIDQQSRSR